LLFSLSIKGEGSLLSIVFVLGSEMINLKKNSNNYLLYSSIVFTAIITTALAVAPFIITSNIATTAATTTAANNAGNAITTTITQPSPSSSGIQLSPQPILREQERLESQTPLNETHFEVVVSGNGTLTLPNATEAINLTTTDNVILSVDGTAV
jgi:hypothetical protein